MHVIYFEMLDVSYLRNLHQLQVYVAEADYVL